MIPGTHYIIGSRLVFFLSSYVIHVFAAHYLGVVEYGYLGILLSLMSFMKQFFAHGLPQTTSKLIAQNQNRYSEVLKSGVTFAGGGSFILFLLFFFLSDKIALFFKDPSLTPLIRITSFSIPLMALLQVNLAALNGKRMFKEQASILSIYFVSRIFFAVLLALLGFRAGGIIFGYILSTLLGALLAIHLNPGILSSRFYNMKEIVLKSVPILIGSLLLTAILNIDMFLVKRVMTAKESIGVYTSANNLAKIPYTLFFAFSMTFLPTVASYHASDQVRLKPTIEKGMKNLIILIVPFVLVFSGFSKEIILIIYKQEFIDAANPLRILSLGFSFLAIYASLMAIFIAVRPVIPVFISCLGVILHIPICLYFIKMYGLVGASWATFISSFIIMITGFIFLKSLLNCSLMLSTISKLIIISIPLYFLEITISGLGVNKFFIILIAPAIVIVYFLSLYGLKEIEKSDFEVLKNKLSSVFQPSMKNQDKHS